MTKANWLELSKRPRKKECHNLSSKFAFPYPLDPEVGVNMRRLKRKDWISGQRAAGLQSAVWNDWRKCGIVLEDGLEQCWILLISQRLRVNFPNVQSFTVLGVSRGHFVSSSSTGFPFAFVMLPNGSMWYCFLWCLPWPWAFEPTLPLESWKLSFWLPLVVANGCVHNHDWVLCCHRQSVNKGLYR